MTDGNAKANNGLKHLTPKQLLVHGVYHASIPLVSSYEYTGDEEIPAPPSTCRLLAEICLMDLIHHGGPSSYLLPPFTSSILVAPTIPVLSVNPTLHEPVRIETVHLAWTPQTEQPSDLQHSEEKACLNSDEAVVDGEVAVVEEMKQIKTKATIGILSTLITYVSLNSWYKTTHPEAFIWQAEDREEATWMATSKSWLDRKACRWLFLCGLPHFHFTRLHLHSKDNGDYFEAATHTVDWQDSWTDVNAQSSSWNKSEKILRQVPDYVLEYAPLVHLFSGEQYWPCDIAEHLTHITPTLNYTPIEGEESHPTLKSLDGYNKYQRGRWVFLTSNDNVEENPGWLGGEKNIPVTPDDPNDDFTDNDGWVRQEGRKYAQGLKDAAGDLQDWLSSGHEQDSDNGIRGSEKLKEAQEEILKQAKMIHQEMKRQIDSRSQLQRIRGGRSDAPAVLIVVDKGHGVVDAFWFFFYSFNLGNAVFNIRFGNHVGDWEHTAIRFYKGEPKAVFFSEHNFGSAYSYDAVEKIGKRPVIYSAVGTHAMYATPGSHPYVLPWGILHDQTDRGPLWDPALNSHMYTYDHVRDIIRSSEITPQSPTQWFHFAGHWGDKFYPLGDKRQYRFAGQYHYVNGPLGPKFKNLGRQKICGGPDSAPCVIKHWLGDENRVTRLQLHHHHHDPTEADFDDSEREKFGVQR